MAEVNLLIKPRGEHIKGNITPETLTFPVDTPVADVFARVAKTAGLSHHRIRLTYAKTGEAHARNVLDQYKPGETIGSIGLQDGTVLYAKDLGPQLGWRTVYIIEYLGPLLLHPLYLLYLRPLVYGDAARASAPSDLQYLLCYLLELHFIKRELETIFVHRFGIATMPAWNIFRNSAHYWLLSGVNIAYWVYSPTAKAATAAPNPYLLYPGLALFVLGELANFNCHLALKNLRKPGSNAREIPRGFGFDVVTCPNYFFEIVAWLGIWLVSGCSWSVLIFISVGGYTMYLWAKGKEKRYRKLFGDKYKKKRSVMIPGLL